MGSDQSPDRPTLAQSSLALLCLALVSSGIGYALLMKLSWQFSVNSQPSQRPTIAMLSLFGGLFLVYWFTLWQALRLPVTRRLVVAIVASSCLFRAILLPSIPMHEIDIYRYLWDGAVLAEGVSPYRYAPEQVVNAVDAGGAAHDPTLQRLVDLQSRSNSLSYSLSRIHYGQYPSPYPFVSQTVFAAAAKVTPDRASNHVRLVVMKSLLVAFDLATLAVLLLLLRELGMHPGWSVAYGWCPLVLKEIANGGHLDSIAIFFTMLALLFLVSCSKTKSHSWRSVSLSAVILALAIGAKLYPVVLLPLFAAVWLRRQGWQQAGVGIVVTGALSALLLYPLLASGSAQTANAPATGGDAAPIREDQLDTSEDFPTIEVEANEGIKAFLKMWEMNDLLFMVVLENLREQDEVEAAQRPWFVVTSDEWARSVVTRFAMLKESVIGAGEVDALKQLLSRSRLKRESFALARLITGGGFAIFACLLAWWAAGKQDPQAWCRAAMLTLAWFWLTCPTQNPWYWCWVVPLLPFARYRAWYLVAAATMLYYLRFWLETHFASQPVFGTPYHGAYFFYFVVAWLEFLPIFAALAVEALAVRVRGRSLEASQNTES